ncbi:MAG: ComF family protein [Propionibacteriaceae bacterium]|nr:ComF family protein [Propionibacteriaceae bacterium]
MRVIDAAADLVLGARCAGCDAPAFGLCRVCATGLRGLAPVAVSRPVAGFPPTVAAGPYHGELRRVVLAAKERQALIQLPLLSRLLAGAVAELLLGGEPRLPVTLVPVPSVRARVIERGIDLTAALAAGAGRRLRGCGAEVRVARAVRLARLPDDQAGLGRRERLANARGAYRCSPRLLAGSVIVIDDVVTTGATLAAVSAALRAVECTPFGAATVAQTQRRGDLTAPAS